MIKQIEHIKKFALQDNSALSVQQLGEAIARMCDDAIREAVEQPLALDDAHVCGWCKGKQNLVWSCPVCDVG